MRKKAIFLMMALALASTPAMLAQEAADTTFVFKDIKVNPTTSVKDQNKSGTCWSFSGVSFLEDELLKNGKGEFDLSEMYIARQCYIDKAIHYVRYCGATNFGQGGSILDVPDNWSNGLYYNVKLDELKKIVDDAIEKGYTVLWAADVSEKGFKWYDGVALMPKIDRNKERTGTELAKWVKLKSSEKEEELYDFKGPVEEIEVTQESRQKGFDNYETTDDHGMVVIGKAEDQKGNKYYKVKNSWDTDQVYQGYFYVSEAYFLSKTMSILVNKKAVPSDLLKKMGL